MPIPDNRTFIYELDAHNILIEVNDAWLEFAVENNAPRLTRQEVIGKSIWSFIDGWETRHIYDLIIDRVRKEQLLIRLPFRCDGPSVRRFLEMEIAPVGSDGAVEFRNRVVRQEERPAVEILEDQYGSGSREVAICSWCKKLKVDEARWEEVEEAVRALRLFLDQGKPKFSHQVCAECRSNILQSIRPFPAASSERGC